MVLYLLGSPENSDSGIKVIHLRNQLFPMLFAAIKDMELQLLKTLASQGSEDAQDAYHMI